MAKLETQSFEPMIVDKESKINTIKQHTKSEQLKNYLTNLNLAKTGNKDVKIRRLIDHFYSNYKNLDTMNEISLKSYCNLFEIRTENDASKNELISMLSAMTDANTNNDASNAQNMSQTMPNDMELPEMTETVFGFQMDQERADNVLIEKTENEIKLIEIDEKQSFLHKYPIDICSKVTYPNESEIIFETSRIGHLSESAIIVNCKGTIVLTTAISKLQNELKFDDALDLKVDAHERSWPRGYIPSGVQRNDGGITDYEILLCRMIDRSIRPLFISGNDSTKISPAFEVQILSNLLSCDDIYDSQVLAINGASAAVYCSPNIDIGENGPIGAVRVIIDKNDAMICNPTKLQIQDEDTKCNLLYVGTNDKCVMIETEANVIDQAKYAQLLQFAQQNVAQITTSIAKLKQLKLANQQETPADLQSDDINHITHKYNLLSEYKAQLLSEDIVKQTETKLFNLYSDSTLSKNHRNSQRELLSKQMTNDLRSQCDQSHTDRQSVITAVEWTEFYKSIFQQCDKKQFRNAYLTNQQRCDGRKFEQVRTLNHMIDILPSSHGSALFERGNTQTLCSATVGPPKLARMRDMHKAGHPETKQRLYFQYEMPPAATNEIKAIQSKNRRCIGHGNIALHALQPLLPSFEQFPYSIRVYSNITSSDGSSSMASVCGGSLALMDAGIPLHAAVAGISIGLMDDVLLTDLCGIEDHFGDMDFKIAGTRCGITSVQLDIKKGDGIGMDLILSALGQAYTARVSILDSMSQTIAASKKELKLHAPRVEIVDVPFRDIPRVIGSGGAVKKKIQLDTNCDINIFWEEECVEITAPNIVALQKAKTAISDVIGSQCRIGDIITAKVINIQSYGVMIQIEDGSEHLVHISQWIDSVGDDIGQYSEGQQVEIMCIGFLGENRPNFSRKAAVWQLSDDAEDRARLRLMLDSLRPPARSRAHPGSAAPAGNKQGQNGNGGHGITGREPLSIFSEGMSVEGDDELVFDGDGGIDGDDDMEDDEDTFEVQILPPPPRSSKKPKPRNELNNTDSIKHLIENISVKPVDANGSGSKQPSRFANLYKDIHSVGGDVVVEENRNGGHGKSVKIGKLINSIANTNGGAYVGGVEAERVDKDSIEHWKSFTNELTASDVNVVEKDEEGDELLTLAFGDEHKPTTNEMSSRASLLMDGIPDLMQKLTDNDNDKSQNEKDKENDNEQVEEKWAWQLEE